MREHDEMDLLLQEMKATTSNPQLSPDFAERVQASVKPRRLNAAGRWVMAAYTIVALALSVWAMKSQAIDWSLGAIAIVIPLAFVAVLGYRMRRVSLPSYR